MKAGIYRIIVRRPGKPDLYYVGQAIDFSRRDRDHMRHLRGKRHANQRLQALFEKYGADIFSFERLLICAPDTLQCYEQAVLDFYIATFGRRVLNICRECVSSSRGTKRSKQSRALMSAAKKGKPGRIWTPESCAKVSATKKGIPPSRKTIDAGIKARTGSTASLETRAKMSAKHTGRTDSDETKAKKSAARKNLSAEARANLSTALLGNQNNLGKKHSPETRQKLSIAAKKREERKRAEREAGGLIQRVIPERTAP
jgi:group I intron endonuclease